MTNNKDNRKGWEVDGAAPLPPLAFTEISAGSLRIDKDNVLLQDPAWRGEDFKTPGTFNLPGTIRNAGGGSIQVLQAGLYLLKAYVASANAATDAEINIRFIVNSIDVVLNSTHQIYERGTNSDRDMISKGVPVFLNACDLVKCELNSNQSNSGLEALSNWTIELKSGLVGNTGVAGSYAPPVTAAFSAYRVSDMPVIRDINGVWKNAFENADLSISCAELYDEQNTFDIVTGLWTPTAGKYKVSGCVSSESVIDTAFVYTSLYNVTLNIEINWGFLGRNEGSSGHCISNFSADISADGLTTYGMYAKAINDTSITILGAVHQTYFSAYKFSDSP